MGVGDTSIDGVWLWLRLVYLEVPMLTGSFGKVNLNLGWSLQYLAQT